MLQLNRRWLLRNMREKFLPCSSKRRRPHNMRSLPSLTYIPVSHCRRQGAQGAAEEAEEAAYKKGQKGHSGLRWEEEGRRPHSFVLFTATQA